jgi:anti-sigma regulatory factor (Ser/Thr protein kinase)
MALAVTEAATNAVRHAYPTDPHGAFFLAAQTDGAELVVIVRDYGVGLHAPSAPGGLGVGLVVIDRLASSCQIAEGRPGTLVTMRFRRPGRAPWRP